jgi:hypothetical protein
MPAQALPYVSCTIRTLPEERWVAAAQSAIAANPANAPAAEMMARAGLEVLEPARLAILTSKYWGIEGVTMTVGFMTDAVRPPGPDPLPHERVERIRERVVHADRHRPAGPDHP